MWSKVFLNMNKKTVVDLKKETEITKKNCETIDFIHKYIYILCII